MYRGKAFFSAVMVTTAKLQARSCKRCKLLCQAFAGLDHPNIHSGVPSNIMTVLLPHLSLPLRSVSRGMVPWSVRLCNVIGGIRDGWVEVKASSAASDESSSQIACPRGNQTKAGHLIAIFWLRGKK